MKMIKVLIVIMPLIILNTNQSISQTRDKKYLAFSGMTKEQAIEVQKAAAEYFNLPLNLKITLNETTFIELVLIPPGEFKMGSNTSKEKTAELFGRNARSYDLEHPQHTVRITKPFYINRYEITQSQWNALMENNPSPIHKPNLPVQNLSWDDCKEFCKLLSSKIGKNFRLPTEAEWEFACRAGTRTEFYFGNELSKKQANYDSDAAIPVGSYPPNAWGLFDMHGNVVEWVEDYYYFYSEDSKTDPWETEYPHGGRMLRGGGYAYKVRALRSAYRYAHLKSMGDQNSGFRIVCPIE